VPDVRSLARKLKKQKRKKLKRVVGVRITEEEYEALKKFAERNGVTVSDVLRAFLESYLSQLVTYEWVKEIFSGGRNENQDNVP